MPKIWPTCLVHDRERKDAPCICSPDRLDPDPKLVVTHSGAGEHIRIIKKEGLWYFIRITLRCFGIFVGKDKYRYAYRTQWENMSRESPWNRPRYPYTTYKKEEAK